MIGTHPSHNALWALQLLTPDYLVDGFCDTDRYPIFTFSTTNYHTCIPTDALQLIQTTVRTTSGLVLPEGDIPNWNVTFYNGFIAVIPKDEASTHFFYSNLGHYPDVPVDVYAGPYVFHGTLPIEKEEFKKLEFLFSIVLKDVEIDCLWPNSTLRNYRVTYAMLRTLHIQGITIRR